MTPGVLPNFGLGFDAEVLAVNGTNPGPAEQLSVDVVVRYPGGGEGRYDNVPLFNPVPPYVALYDVYGPELGSSVGLCWRGGELRFKFDWFPVTTNCTQPNPLAFIQPDPYRPAKLTVMRASGMAPSIAPTPPNV